MYQRFVPILLLTAGMGLAQSAEHVVNRLTFGARPGDVAQVQKIGVKKWIDRQLNPSSIPENPKLTEALAGFETLSLSTSEMIEKFGPKADRPVMGVREIANELTQAKLYRAVLSERQLEEVMTDFWFNHFNVFFAKGADRWLTTAYERDAIRPHVLGRFEDLLKATAQHPAMLFYLDNWTSVAAGTGSRGLNENYARELMELHTLGVDGGYTQKDVQEVARCFTGWTIERPNQVGKFRFTPRVHDGGEKVVLGTKIAAGGGMEDGMKVIELLAHHPSTARFISRKLAQRFVADEPPEALVGQMAKTFQKSGGDIRAVLKTLFHSKEFQHPKAYQSKVKSPLEMVASALRATSADVSNMLPAAQAIANMGQPLYRKQEPTGYSNTGEDWLNSAGLLARINFAVALSENKLRGIRIDTAQFAQLARNMGAPEAQKR